MSKMGRTYFNPDKREFSEIANEKRGYIYAIAKHYGVAESTIYALQVRDQEIKTILQEARRVHHENELDLAISLNFHFMQDYKNNPGLASLHARYTIDKRGQSRGYRKDNDDMVDESIEKKFDEKMDQMLDLLASSVSSDLKIEDSNISNDTKS